MTVPMSTHEYLSNACVSRVDPACEQFALRRMVCRCACHKGPVAYLSGPMTGVKDLNRPLFMAAAQQLRSLGFQVINPATQPPGQQHHEYMRQDLLELLAFADVLVALDGWGESVGATVERSVAQVCGLTIADIDDTAALELALHQWQQAQP